MSMDNALLRFPQCVGCDEGVDENNPSLGYHMDEDKQYWHATCWSVYCSENEYDIETGKEYPEPEPDYDFVRYEDSQSYRDSMTDAGRGHLLR